MDDADIAARVKALVLLERRSLGSRLSLNLNRTRLIPSPLDSTLPYYLNCLNLTSDHPTPCLTYSAQLTLLLPT